MHVCYLVRSRLQLKTDTLEDPARETATEVAVTLTETHLVQYKTWSPLDAFWEHIREPMSLCEPYVDTTKLR